MSAPWGFDGETLLLGVTWAAPFAIDIALRATMILVAVSLYLLIPPRRRAALPALRLAAFALLLLPFASLFTLPTMPAAVTRFVQRATPVRGASLVRVDRDGVHPTAPSKDSRPLGALVLCVWVAGVAAYSLRQLASVRHARRIVQASHVASHSLASLVASEIGRLHLRRNVMVRVSDQDVAPMVLGGRSVALVVGNSFDQWSDAEQRAVVRHELAHILQSHDRWRLLTNSVAFLYWFHPLARHLVRAVELEHEMRADRAAVKIDDGSRFAFARLLVEVAAGKRSAKPTARVAMTFGATSGRALRVRIDALIRAEPRHVTVWQRTLALLVCGVALCGALTSARPPLEPALTPTATAPALRVHLKNGDVVDLSSQMNGAGKLRIDYGADGSLHVTKDGVPLTR